MMRPYVPGLPPRYAACHDPITIAMIGLTVLGGVASASAQAQQGAAAAAAGRYNQQLYDQQAQQTLAEANARAQIQARETARKMGQTRAAYGAAGVELDGTPLDVLADQATEGELQRRLILYGGATQAQQLQQRGAMSLWQGNQAETAADAAAVTTLITTGARAGFMAYQASSSSPSGPTVGKVGNVGGSYGGYSGAGQY